MEQGNRGWVLRFTKGFDRKAALSRHRVTPKVICGTKRVGLYLEPSEPFGLLGLDELWVDVLLGFHLESGYEQIGRLRFRPVGDGLEPGERTIDGWTFRFTKGYDGKATLSRYRMIEGQMVGTDRTALYFCLGEPLPIAGLCEEMVDVIAGFHIEPGHEVVGQLTFQAVGVPLRISDGTEE